MINALGIASGPDDWKYGLHPEHVIRGWPWRIAQLEAAAAIGARTQLLHLPFGRITSIQEPPGYSPLDMAPRLLADTDARYARLVTTFAASIGAFIRRGNAVVAYLGRFDELAPLLVPGRYDDWMRRLVSSVKPVLDAGCDIAIDASALLAVDTVEYAALLMLRRICERQGRRVWIESRPSASARHLAGWPVMSTERDWQRAQGAMEREDLGPVIRMWTGGPNPGESEAQYGVRLAGELAGFTALCATEDCYPAWDVNEAERLRTAATTG